MKITYTLPAEIKIFQYEEVYGRERNQSLPIHAETSTSLLEDQLDILSSRVIVTFSTLYSPQIIRQAFDYTQQCIETSIDRIDMNSDLDRSNQQEQIKALRDFADYLLRMLEQYKQQEKMLARNIGDPKKSEEFKNWISLPLSELQS